MIRLRDLLQEGDSIRPGDKVRLTGTSFGGYHVQGKNDTPKSVAVRPGDKGTVVRLDGEWAIVDFGHYESARVRKSDLVAEALSTQREPRSPGFNEPSWDWRTQKKGDHWKTRSGKFGARAQTGEVDYFDDEKQAQQFAQHSHTGQAGTYVAGQFAKGEVKEADYSGPQYADARKAAKELLDLLSPADRKEFIEWLKKRKLAREKGLDPNDIKEALPHQPDSKYRTAGSKSWSLPELNRRIQQSVEYYMETKQLDKVLDAKGDVAYDVKVQISLHRRA